MKTTKVGMIRLIFRMLTVVYWCLSVGVLGIVFARYRDGLLPEVIVPYMPYYLLCFIILLLIIFFVTLGELRNKFLNVFFFVPYFLATLLVSMANNEEVSDVFSPLVAVTGTLGFLCTIFMFLSVATRRAEAQR